MNLVANAQIIINAPVGQVWNALTDPKAIKEYMFGAHVVTDWQVGSEILWKGKWKGKSYEDKGKILKMEERRMLQYTHFSPLSGAEDKPENYHTVTIKLSEQDNKTKVKLTQDNNASEEEKMHFEKNWNAMLEVLKKTVEEK